MKVYLAASSEEMPRARAAMALLREFGHEVTHDWIALIEEVGLANPTDVEPSQRGRWAVDDLNGVGNAEILWLLMPAHGGRGAFVELGYAFARKIPVVVSGPGHAGTIFTALACCYDNDIEALEAEFATEDDDA